MGALGRFHFQKENALSSKTIQKCIQAWYLLRCDLTGHSIHTLHLLEFGEGVLLNLPFTTGEPGQVSIVKDHHFPVRGDLQIHFYTIDPEVNGRLDGGQCIFRGSRGEAPVGNDDGSLALQDVRPFLLHLLAIL